MSSNAVPNGSRVSICKAVARLVTGGEENLKHKGTVGLRSIKPRS